MEQSFNCSVLGYETYETLNSLSEFSVNFYKKDNEIFTKLRDKCYDIKKFKVDHLKDYICEVTNSHKNAVRLWRVNVVDEVGIKEKLKDENEMKPRLLFSNYFQGELYDKAEFAVTNIHVIAIISIAGPSQQDVLQVPLKSIEDILKSVLEDFTSRISETHTSRSDTYISQFDCYDIPLKDRDLPKIAAIIKRNVINNLRVDSLHSYAKTDFNILVCGGAPGIGKTQLGNELFHNIETNGESLFDNITSFKRFEYIYLDFGNSIKLDERDYSLDNDNII
ncbi:hypothetical protein RclHR1_06720003 [Rhizophagus clarus]|uniref:Uncharacterized protein n=1 Tax=Rhizophagus clarus TaxID=94130 RepID=A0A2Z6SJD1_9GLOM|nr:hypothetical protein RclHR1_06720003 [Rhizophagus clarus]